MKLLALLLIALPLCASAGESQFASRLAIGETRNRGMVFAVVPDIQNYCASWDPSADSNPPAADRADGIRQLELMVRDIIDERVEFVLQVGDIADTMGGVDENGNAGYLDDPNNFTANFARYDGELQCSYDHFFKLLRAANIPVLWVAGNHDSCVDLERIMPVSLFRLFSYYSADQSRAARCSAAALVDTMQRSALFSTTIGPICAVGGRYNGPENDATDIAWVNGAVGCGAGHPTILMNHNGVGFETATYGGAANDEVFMGVHGHTVPLGLVVSDLTASGGHELYKVGVNYQESSRNCQGFPIPQDPGAAMHTGVGAWARIRLVPETSSFDIQVRMAVFGGTATRPTCSYNANPANGTYVFSPTLCSRFPSMGGC